MIISCGIELLEASPYIGRFKLVFIVWGSWYLLGRFQNLYLLSFPCSLGREEESIKT